MFRSALVALKPDRAGSVVPYAVELAKAHALKLRGLAVVDVVRLHTNEAVPLGASLYKSDRDAQHLEIARQLAKTVALQFEDACRSARVPFSVEVVDGDTAGALARAALCDDVLICGHTPGGVASERSLLQSILKHNARPTLVVPRDPAGGANVLLAYDGSFQAARALASLVNSGLLTNRSLQVITLHEEFATAATRSVSAMSFLSHHEIKADSHAEILDREPAAHLMDAARRYDAGLIVMGAFGRNSVLEFVFGSTTQTMLELLPADTPGRSPVMDWSRMSPDRAAGERRCASSPDGRSPKETS